MDGTHFSRNPVLEGGAASTRRAAVDAAQAALDKAHADVAATKGKRMRLIAELEETNERLSSAMDAIGRAETQMANALANEAQEAPATAQSKPEGLATTNEPAGLTRDILGLKAEGQLDNPGGSNP